MMKNSIFLITMLFITGCSMFGGTKPIPPIVVENRVQSIPVFHPPLPDTVLWQEVEWKVLTPELMQEYLDDYNNGDARAQVWYGLTPEGYRALSENTADLKRYIIQSNGLLVYYRDNLVDIIIEQVPVPPPVPQEQKKKSGILFWRN